MIKASLIVLAVVLAAGMSIAGAQGFARPFGGGWTVNNSFGQPIQRVEPYGYGYTVKNVYGQPIQRIEPSGYGWTVKNPYGQVIQRIQPY